MTLVLRGLDIRPPHAKPLFLPVDLTVLPGQIGTIMGPSGAGKSTLLAAIGGHLPHGFTYHGDVLLNGQSLQNRPAHTRRIGVMFQDALLFPHLSVGDNLAFGLTPAVMGRTARRAQIDQALAQAGLSGMADRDPATLSGGERARIALMRTLLANPLALLLDEPFSKLDLDRRGGIRAFVFRHIRDRNIPALIVTHDPEDAAAAAGPAAFLTP